IGGLCIHALGNIGTLGSNGIQDEHTIRVKNIVIMRVADFTDGLARDDIIVELGLGGDFAAHDHEIALGVGFAGHAAGGVLGQAGVEDRVRNSIANFVRVALADGLGREDVVFAHYSG